MTKKITEEIVRLQEENFKTTKSVAENTIQSLRAVCETMDTIADKLIVLYRAISIIIYVLIILIWRIYFFKSTNQFISNFIGWWPNLSEAWQIFIVSIPTLIVVNIITNLLVKKISAIKNKK